MTIPDWFNGSFIVVILTMFGACGAGILTFLLKSRCRTIKCCCIECERDVIPVRDLNSIEVTARPIQAQQPPFA